MINNNQTFNFVVSLTINCWVLNDIANRNYKNKKSLNIQHVHFEYIPNFENANLASFFSSLEYLQTISFDKKRIEASKYLDLEIGYK